MNGRNCCRFLVIVMCLLFWQNAQGVTGSGDPDQLFQLGNEAYSRGEYDQAIARYEELTAIAGFSPAVLYNLANSYAQTGKIGRAVLNYERALRLAPEQSDILGNLELVRKESGLFTSEPGNGDKFFHSLSLDQWTMLGFFALVCFTLFQIATIRYHLAGKIRTGVMIVCSLIFVLGVLGTVVRYQQFQPSVVINTNGRLLISPFTSASSVGSIQEGRLVYPEKIHGPFTYVKDESNRRGWIITTDIEAIIRN